MIFVFGSAVGEFRVAQRKTFDSAGQEKLKPNLYSSFCSPRPRSCSYSGYILEVGRRKSAGVVEMTQNTSETKHQTVSLLSKLNAQAPVRHAQHGIPIERYYRSAALLLRQVEQYRASQDSSTYYVFLLRYVQLVLQTIPEHRGFGGGRATAYRELREEVVRLMPELERVKGELQGIQVPVGSRRGANRRVVGQNVPRLQSGHVPGVTWDENVGKDSGKFGSQLREPQQSQEPRQSPSDAMRALVGSIEGASTSGRPSSMSSHTLSSHPLKSHTTSRTGMYPDPRVGMRLGPQELEVTSLVPRVSSQPRIQPPPPSSIHSYDDHGGQLVEAGQRGRHDLATCCTPAQLEPTTHVADKVTQTIRNVHISAALMNEFLRYASSNTRASIETCGILAGQLRDTDGSGQLSTFIISHLIVPKQEGTSDTVQALAEEEIYEAQDSRSLYPLGWIHTHPTQTCFLSSIDVHTQCGYQTMLDEAIAIVMAPTDAKSPVGIFRLSTPGGLKQIQKCSERGFHPHGPTETGQPLYELCNHVYLDPGVGFEVLDLR